MPVLIDSGFRRGTDIVKALCMGAKGVAIGRPYLWGLGAFGQPGVERVLQILRTELKVAMQQVGAPSLKDLKPSMVVRALIANMNMKQASSRDRLEQALARIADPNGEGARACLTVYHDAARAAADAADARARAGVSLGPLDGAIVSIKDLFDVAGEPTRAGSKILAEEAAPAAADAAVVRRLRAARRGDRRQDQHDRVCLFRHRRQSAFRHAGKSARPRARARRLVGGRAGRASPTACARSPSAPIPAVRCGFRRRCAGWSASSRAGSACRPTARFR